MFDIGGMFCVLSIIAFVEKNVSGAVSAKTVAKAIVRNPIIIAMLLGLVLNALGVGHGMAESGVVGLNDAVANMITRPIEGIVLFVLGYELRIEATMIGPLLRMLVLRLLAAGAIIGGFFLLFADRMAQQPFFVAVILYFLGPPSFMMTTLVGPYCDDDRQKSFMSAFMPLNVLIAIVVYLCLAVMVGHAG
jgi:predicted permease